MWILKLDEISEAERNELMRTLKQINRKRKRDGVRTVKYEMKKPLIAKTIRSK